MKTSKKILNDSDKAPVIQRRVRSHSNPSEYHIVSLFKDNKMTCDCIAGKLGRDCKHKKLFVKHYGKERHNYL